MDFHISKANKIVKPKGTSVNIRKEASTDSQVIAVIAQEVTAGRTSGFYENKNDGLWYEINLQEPKSGLNVGFVREDVVKLIESKENTVAQDNAQQLVNSILKNDLEIFKTLVRCANIIIALDKNNIDTTKHKKVLKYLSYSLGTRQGYLINSGLAVSYKTGYPKAYTDLINGYKKIVESLTGIGIIPVLVIIVVFAIGAATAVGAYYAFRPRYDESKKDLKISNELEKALSTLSPSEAEKVKNELEKQIDNAYNSGKEQGTFSGMFSFIKPLAFALGGFWLITKFVDSQTRRKEKNG
ncbi:MAG: hypothetical protein M0R21_12530 [Lentimicrobiaceae bacterium]|jgi:hypothetical protein|nr:hypothetical protein [Lentimicrobiaceae bacterium]